jgi:hypothetical protein
MYDGANEAVLLISEQFSGANDRSFIAVDSKSLRFANTSQNCIVDLVGVEYASGFASGGLTLYWDASSPVNFLNLGKTQSGHLNTFVTNSAVSPTGNIGIQVYGSAANDSYSLILKVRKLPTQGYANGWASYNDEVHHY